MIFVRICPVTTLAATLFSELGRMISTFPVITLTVILKSLAEQFWEKAVP
jgi:hypothetical protein